MNRIFALLVAAFVIIQPGVGRAEPALPGQRIERSALAKGAASTVIKGQLKGDAFVDYVLSAGAGQTLMVKLEPSNLSNYFNINPPGTDVSMFIGSTSGNIFRTSAPGRR